MSTFVHFSDLDPANTSRPRQLDDVVDDYDRPGFFQPAQGCLEVPPVTPGEALPDLATRALSRLSRSVGPSHALMSRRTSSGSRDGTVFSSSLGGRTASTPSVSRSSSAASQVGEAFDGDQPPTDLSDEPPPDLEDARYDAATDLDDPSRPPTRRSNPTRPHPGTDS